jgi:hypothetical protein
MTDNYPAVPVQWENGPPLDQDTCGPLWLDVSVKVLTGKNVTSGVRARGRENGVISTNLYVKAGEGLQQADAIVEGLRELLRNCRVGGGVLFFPVRGNPPQMLGWYQLALKTPFYLDSA